MKGNYRILYAEDSPFDAEITLEHFRSAAPEFFIDIANTGKECLRLLEENTSYDLLLTDYVLPDINGLCLQLAFRF